MDWWEMAACRQGDPERFFPEGRALRHRVDAAKTVCASCDVRERCLSWALTMDVTGVWGGYTLRERRRSSTRPSEPARLDQATTGVRACREAAMDDAAIDRSASTTPDPGQRWRAGALDAMDDGELAAAARAGFAWYRSVLADPEHQPEPDAFARLVALQGEYMRRFPAGDLSAPSSAGGGPPWIALVGA